MFLVKGLSVTRYRKRFTPSASSTRESSGGKVVTLNVTLPMSCGLFNFPDSSAAMLFVTEPMARELLHFSQEQFDAAGVPLLEQLRNIRHTRCRRRWWNLVYDLDVHAVDVQTRRRNHRSRRKRRLSRLQMR